MDKLYYSKDIIEIDEISQNQYKQPGIILMEQAGLKAWLSMKKNINKKQNILVVAGGGNNGGDALVVARCMINDGYNNVKIIYCSSNSTKSTLIQKQILDEYNVESYYYEDNLSSLNNLIYDADIIIDGICAIGLKYKLRKKIEELIIKINNSSSIVYSIDVPSGMNDNIENICINANYTFCMGPLKLLYFFYNNVISCGELIKINPSFPPFAISKVKEIAYLENNLDLNITPLKQTDYKKTRGHLAIFGGSKKYSGALRLTSKAAFSSRCGLVSVFCDKEIYEIVAIESPSIIVNTLEKIENLSKYDAILVGPGWSLNREDLLNQILLSACPMVIDADGIRAFASLYKENELNIKLNNLIFTPHLGELKILADSVLGEYSLKNTVDFFDTLKKLSNKLNATIVCKASITYVVSPNKEIVVIKQLNPSLAVAGSGDVLAGCIAALLSISKDIYYSAIEGVKLHMRAGLQANSELGFYTSEELIKYIGKQLS